MSSPAIALPPRTPVPKRRATTRRGQGRDDVAPTLELMRHKAQVLGGTVNAKGRPVGFDVNASTWPLDVYLLMDVIAPRHHKAGCRYAADRRALFGDVGANTAAAWRQVVPEHLADEIRVELTDDEREDIWVNRAKRLREASTLLQKRQVFGVVRLVVLDGIFVPRESELLLRFGLEALAAEWRIADD